MEPTGTKRKSITKFLLGFLFIAAAIEAQVNVNVMIRQPTPSQIYMWEHDNTIVQIIMTNATGPSYPDVRVSFVIRDVDKDKIVMHTIDANPSMPHFSLPQGGMVTRYGRDIVNQSALWFDPSLNTSLLTSNSFPEGNYEFCMTLLNNNNDTITTTGVLCKPFTVMIPDPPSLILPNDKDSISTTLPPTFTWTPVNAPGVIPAYRLVIAPVFKGQTAPDAIGINAPLIMKEIHSSSYFYDPSNPLFTNAIGAVGFAWQVTALDPSGRPLSRNDGKSEVFSFYPLQKTKTDSVIKTTDTVAAVDTAGTSCVADCNAPAPTSTTPATKAFAVGDSVTIGLFKLKITNLTASTGNALSGEGTIVVPFLHAPIKVQFTSVKVNDHNEIFDGQVIGKQDNGSPIADAAASATGTLGLSSTELTAVSNYAKQPLKIVSSFTGSTPVGLPLGLDNYIDGVNMTIAIMGLVFTPTKATLNAVAEFPMPDLGPGVGIGVGARDISFHPHGLGAGAGTLYLSQDLGYNRPGSFGFVFRAPTASDSGTYLRWDCRGFQFLHVKAHAIFPRDWFTPDPDNGDTVKATFTADIRKCGDWIAKANLPACVIVGTNGMKIKATTMDYDHSDIKNPAGITFPAGYPSSMTGPDWHGFYIASTQITLPEDLKTFDSSSPAITASNCIIDDQGFSGKFDGRNIIHYPNGNFGKWGASVDSMNVEFLKSSLTHGEMNGRIQVPISDSALKYVSLLNQVADSGLSFSFTITPASDIPANLWAAKLSLDKTSIIALSKEPASGFKAKAVLNGKISISGLTGGIPGLKFDHMSFTGLGVQTDAPYVSTGTWSFASPEHGIMGFPVSISNINVVTGSRTAGFGVGLAMNFDLNLSESLSGSTGVTLWGVMSSSGPQHFAYDGIQLDSIKVDADMGAVNVKGKVAFYTNNSTYGNGFRGELDASFLKNVEVKAVAQFGSVNDFRYWNVDASTIFPDPGIVMSPGLAFYGFGGGAWYHMRRSTTELPPPTHEGHAGSSPGSTASGYVYTPDKNVPLGLHAAVTLATTPSKDAFNGDAALDMQFVPSGIGEMTLSGKGWMMTDPAARSNTMTATVAIDYNFSTSTFHGNFNYLIDMNPTITSHGQMVIHVDPAVWYLTVGTPDEPVTASLLNFVDSKAYFMTGNRIPSPPDLPDYIKSKFPTFATARNPLIDGGAGFVFGASAGFHTGRVTYLIFYGQVDAGMGFDLSLMNVGSLATCEGANGPVGLNGWYASGDIYAYLSASIGLHVDVWFTSGDFEILGVNGAAALTGGAPNPSWLKGGVDGSYDILDGLVSGDCHFEFTLGKTCIPDPGTPFDKIDIISAVQPGSGKGVDVFVQPQAAFNFTLGKEIELSELSEDGSSHVRIFRVKLVDFSIAQADHSVPSTYGVSSDGVQATLTPQECLAPLAQHAIHVSATGEEYKNGSWVTATRKDGSPVMQEVTTRFTTGIRPDSIAGRNVMYSYPFNRQRFFLQNETHAGRLALRTAQSYLFQPRSGYTDSYVARFVPLTSGGTEIESPLSFNGPNLVFSTPQLSNQTVYAVQIIRKEKPDTRLDVIRSQLPDVNQQVKAKNVLTTRNLVNPVLLNAYSSVTIRKRELPGIQVRQGEKLLYVWYFKTSKYSTLSEKISSLKQVGVNSSSAGKPVRINFNSGEGWDTWDVENHPYDAGNGAVGQQRPLLAIDAFWMNSKWHKQFVNPWVYDAISHLRSIDCWDGSPTALTKAIFNQDIPLASVDASAEKTLQDYELSPPAKWMIASDLNLTGKLSISSSLAAITSGSSTSSMSAALHFPSITGQKTSGLAPVPQGDFHVEYNHDLITASDYSLTRNNIAAAMSNLFSIGKIINDWGWVSRQLAKPYEPIYTNDTYQVEFAYNYPDGSWLFNKKIPLTFINGTPTVKTVTPVKSVNLMIGK